MRMNETLNHTEKLCAQLNEYRKSNFFCDVILKLADGSEYPAHRVILAASSQYFQTSFTSGFDDSKSEIYNINNLNSSLTEALLKYFYTGIIQITHDNVTDLVYAADFMLVESLKLKCKNFMLEDLDSSNFLRYHFLCKHYFNNDMVMVDAMQTKSVGVYGMFEDEFLLQLSFLQIKELIQDNIMKSVQEKQLVSFIIRWSEYDEERKEHVVELLNLITWEFVPTFYLKKLLDITPCGHKTHQSMLQLLHERELSDPLPIIHIIRSRAATAVCCGFIPSHDKWVSLAPIPVNICGCVLKTTTLNNKLYVLCCKDQFAARIHKILRSCLMRYDPETNEWTELPCPLVDKDDVCNIEGIHLLSSKRALYFTNTKDNSISKFIFGENKWQTMVVEVNRWHRESTVFVKIVKDVMFFLGMNTFYSNYHYTLVMVDLKRLKSELYQLDTYCQLPSGQHLPVNRWPAEYRFRLHSCHNIQLPASPNSRKFKILNDFDETVCNVDLKECKIVFCFTQKSDSYKKRGFQSIQSDKHVFLASTEDRSCAMFHIATGFLKYVEENPLFPTFSRRSFSMSNLLVPARLAERVLPSASANSLKA